MQASNKAKTPSAATLEVQSSIPKEKGIKSMNNSISLVEKSQLTMSSRELLDVINKVRLEENERAVRVNQFHERVADELSDFNYKTFVVENLNNTKSTYFELTQDMCMLVAMRESKKVRRIVLEQLKSKFNQESYSLPQTLPEALRLAAELAEEKLQLEHKVEEMKPTVAAFDRIATKTEGSMCVTDTAKHLQVQPRKFFQELNSMGWIYKRTGSHHWLGYQDKVKQGLLEHKVTTVSRSDGSEKIVEQVLVTPKGLTKLSQMISLGVAV